MLQVALSPDLERHLADIAARVGKAPDELARRALEAYLEDLEDYATAVEAWKEFDPKDAIPLEQAKRELGLED
jgi:predicted DNA-binding protein